MLEIDVAASEVWDNDREEFVIIPAGHLCLEHSLISLSKWEAKHEKPFLVDDPAKTAEELLDYVRCMTVNKGVKSETYLGLTKADYEKINAYVGAPMTATTFSDTRNRGNGNKQVSYGKRRQQIVTSEVIYYDMIAFNIPFECEKWHINRLLTLIRVCSIKSQPDKKMKGKDLARNNRSLNAARRAQHHTKG
jgi:hypothetical protein